MAHQPKEIACAEGQLLMRKLFDAFDSNSLVFSNTDEFLSPVAVHSFLCRNCRTILLPVLKQELKDRGNIFIYDVVETIRRFVV